MKNKRYEIRVVFILSFLSGIVGLIRMSISYLLPYLKVDFEMSNTLSGAIISTMSIFFALSKILLGTYSDKVGRKKVIILSLMFAVIMLFLVAMSKNIVMLFIFWGLVGFGLGGLYAPTVAIINEESSPKRRGTNLGLPNAMFTLIGIALGSLIITNLVSKFSWRTVFIIFAVIAFIWAIMIIFYIKEPRQTREKLNIKKNKDIYKIHIKEVFKYKNMRIAQILIILIMTWNFVLSTFIVLYLTGVKDLDNISAGMLLSAMGFGGFFGSIIVPTISDYIGRKKTIIIFATIAVINSLAFININLSYLGLYIILFIQSVSAYGFVPIIFAIIPGETVPREILGTATSVPSSIGDIVGAFLMPFIAGLLADLFGLTAAIYVTTFALILVIFIAFFLKETAPRIVENKKN